jgi:plasmid replication initiation protein
MSDQSWDEQFKKFLQQTGEDFRRAGKDIKTEAQRLLDGAVDADKQQKIRDRLNELGAWARKAAQGVAVVVEDAANKAETALQSAAEKVTEKVSEMKSASATSKAPSGTRAPEALAKPSRAKKKPSKAKKSGAKRKR